LPGREVSQIRTLSYFAGRAPNSYTRHSLAFFLPALAHDHVAADHGRKCPSGTPGRSPEL